MSLDRRALLAEFIGTFGLIFMGAGAIVADSFSGERMRWTLEGRRPSSPSASG